MNFLMGRASTGIADLGADTRLIVSTRLPRQMPTYLGLASYHGDIYQQLRAQILEPRPLKYLSQFYHWQDVVAATGELKHDSLLMNLDSSLEMDINIMIFYTMIVYFAFVDGGKLII